MEPATNGNKSVELHMLRYTPTMSDVTLAPCSSSMIASPIYGASHPVTRYGRPGHVQKGMGTARRDKGKLVDGSEQVRMDGKGRPIDHNFKKLTKHYGKTSTIGDPAAMEDAVWATVWQPFNVEYLAYPS